jgi:hypothetical protein
MLQLARRPAFGLTFSDLGQAVQCLNRVAPTAPAH